jgi:hypothetical protein
MADVFKQSDTIPRRAQYNINIHAIKTIYLVLTTNFTGIIPMYHRLIAPT